MMAFRLLVACGATALLVSVAQAADLTAGESYLESAPAVEPSRIVCDEFRRCWREPRRRTVLIERDSYNEMPRGRIVERRYYDADRPAGEIDVDAPGVSVGPGYRW